MPNIHLICRDCSNKFERPLEGSELTVHWPCPQCGGVAIAEFQSAPMLTQEELLRITGLPADKVTC